VQTSPDGADADTPDVMMVPRRIWEQAGSFEGWDPGHGTRDTGRVTRYDQVILSG